MSAQTISENQLLFDRTIEHYMKTRAFEKNLRIKQDRISADHRAELAAALDADINAPIRPLYQKYTRVMKRFGISNVGDFVADELDFNYNNIYTSTRNFYTLRRPSKLDTIDSFLRSPIFGKLPMEDQYDRIGEAALMRAEKIIKNGLINGDLPNRILRDVLKTVELPNHQAKTLLRTAITKAETHALDAVVQQNKEIIKAYEYTAILDARTSSLCSSLDGTMIRLDETSKFPPRHFNCRSSLVPILKSKEEMLKNEDLSRFSTRKLDRVSETRLDGQISAKEDFSTWLYRQDFETKLKHLGDEERVALFDAGVLEVKDFFSSKGKPISLAELKLASARRIFGFQKAKPVDLKLIQIKNSRQLLNNKEAQKQLKQLFIEDSINANQPLSLVDYRGTSLAGKREVRGRAANTFDERNLAFDPLTGEQTSNLYYDPDFEYYRTREDYVRNSKLLTAEQREFVINFTNSLEDQVSRNQQTVILENLRVILERANRDETPWDNLAAIVRAENRFSVVNVSRGLDRRSRARAQLFSLSSEDDGIAYILGERVSFDQIIDDFQKNKIFLSEWSRNEGRELALKAYGTGRVPLRSLFKLRTFTQDKKLRSAFRKGDLLGYIKTYFKGKIKDATKFPRDLLDRYWYKNKETYLEQFIRENKEQVYRILTLEFFYRGRGRSLLNKVGTELAQDLDKESSLDVLAGMFEEIAAGESTDYDALAIKFGEIFQQKFGVEYPFMDVSLRAKHELGSSFLEGMRNSGLITVENRGVVRRAILDLETGRPTKQGYKDTLSRSVVAIDPELIKYQRVARQQVIGTRLGIVGPQNDLIPRKGSLNFYDVNGRRTDVKIITRSAAKHFDEKMVDEDVVNFINKAMAFEYEVDEDFASFMDRLLRFRDPRGNTRYYDDLNSFRQVILKRRELGEGFMQTVKWHLKRGKPFRARAQIDSRGRLYFNGYLQPTGGEMVRPFLNTAQAKQITVEGVKELQYQLGAHLGSGDEALSNAGRLAVFNRERDSLLRLTDNLLLKTQPDRRIRDFLEHPIIRELDGEEIPVVTRLALEYRRIHDYTGGDVYNINKLKGYKTKLGAEIDASASAVQIISLATGKRNLALTSNVVETTKKNRIYDLVAQDTKSDPAYLALEERLGIELSWKDLSKGAKMAVMLRGYGSGNPGIVARITKELQDVLKENDVLVTSRAEELAFIKKVDAAIKESNALGAEAVEDSLKQLKEEFYDAIRGDEQAAKRAVDIASDYGPDLEYFVTRFMSPRTGVVSPDDFKEISNIMLGHLESRAPGMDDYIQFWKVASVKFINDTKKVAIPLRTFDDKRWVLRFRPVVEHEVRFWDPKSRRYVKNIYKDVVEDDKFKGKMSITDARTGYGVSFTHANDAAVLRLIYKEAERNGINLTSIHDAIFANLEDLGRLRDYGRVAYATARKADIIRKTLDEMRNDGLSTESYNELLALAKSKGLFANEFTPEEILERRGPEFDYYGWGQ
jgi:SPP1 gp7 family putative phage head morphogenesis protein